MAGQTILLRMGETFFAEALRYEYLDVLAACLLTQKVQVLLSVDVHHVDGQQRLHSMWTATTRQTIS